MGAGQALGGARHCVRGREVESGQGWVLYAGVAPLLSGSDVKLGFERAHQVRLPLVLLPWK